MHGIKYFFLNKNNQTIQRGQKKFSGGGQLPKTLPKNTIFQNPGGARAPPGLHWVRPWAPLWRSILSISSKPQTGMMELKADQSTTAQPNTIFDKIGQGSKWIFH
jgi:hypothetical protein